MPDLPADGGERVGEGWTLLAIPGAGGCGAAGLGCELGCQQGDEGEQAEQAGRGAGDGRVRPLALRFDPEVVAHLAERGLHLPALDEPAQHLHGVLNQISAEQGLCVELAERVADQHPPDRHDGHPGMAPKGGGAADLDGALVPALPA